MNLAIYADGGPSIGYGHLVRTSALAKEFLDRGYEIKYITATPNSAREIVPDEATIYSVPEPADVVSFAESSDLDVLVTDSYEIDHEVQQRLRPTVSQLGVIMDWNPHPVCCDVLINGNLYAPEIDHEWTGTEPVWCVGTDYLILRDEIRKYVGKDPPWREKPERAIITMGGGDQENVTPTAMEAINEFDIAVDVVVGPGFSESQEQEIRSATENVTADMNVVRNPDDLAERMFLSDFALSTASTTTYELLALGTPIISVQVVDNQKPIANALRSRNLALVINDLYSAECYRRAIERYMCDSELREVHLNRGCRLIDGNGIERVAETLTQGD